MNRAVVALLLAAAIIAPRAAARDQPASAAPQVRIHGSVEPVRSLPVFVPRLSGGGVNSVVITHLTKAGTRVRKGDLLAEFDSQSQLKTARDREAEYRGVVEQINKLRADQAAARAHDEMA